MTKSNVVVTYMKESIEELRKVTWPTKEQTIRSTIVVLAVSLIFAAIMGALDLGFSYGFKALIDLF